MEIVKVEFNKIWIGFTVCTIGLIVSACIGSRAFLIGYVASIVFLILAKYRINSRLIIAGSILLVSISTIAIAYLYKVDSSLGRILIYKVSFAVLHDNYLSGVGLGKFNHSYMLYQAEYFKHGQYSEKESMLAGNIYCAYNDYLQFAVELGIFGVFCSVAYITTISILFYKLISSQLYQSIFTILAMTQIITLSVAACFTFVFEREVFQFVLIVSYAIIVTRVVAYELRQSPRILLRLYYFVSICYLSSFFFYLNNQREISNVLNNTLELSEGGYKKEALLTLKSLYPRLENNREYLHQLGVELYSHQEYSAALKIFLKESEIESNSSLYRMLGQCYLENKLLDQAEISFVTSVNMVPSRFTERYVLYKFYKQSHQLLKAQNVKKIILSLPIKVQSSEIMLIKNSLQKDIY